MSHFSPANPIAYFCAEFGLDASLPLYAGGLGVLAGDTLKAAVDAQLPMVGVGLLYRGNEAKQVISPQGRQTEENIPVDPLSLGLEPVTLDDQPVFIRVHLSTIDVWLQCWQKKLSQTVTLYLLDSETEQNHYTERALTHSLYSGTEEWQLKQQLLLGIGGVKLLHELGIHPAVYHVNEGRPAFLHWQLIRSYMDAHGCDYQTAKQKAKGKTVYTNHTLVGAGNPGYSAGLVETFGNYYAQKMGISMAELLADGVENGDTSHFEITRFALNTARKANGVSRLHTSLSRVQWPEYDWTAITNGVHAHTWQLASIRELSDQWLDQPNYIFHDSATEERQLTQLWSRHLDAKQSLASFAHQQTGFSFDPSALIVTWARRITGYKQLPLLFSDVERLRSILAAKNRPVQLIVAGKAHYGDEASKQVIHEVIELFSTALSGYALFIPDYNLTVAQKLVQGSDLWLNTPEYGKEASGTSGMKALANGVLNCSVADGWVPEINMTDKGWLLDHTRLSESIYELLEQKIIPEYYERSQSDLPMAWLAKMKASVLSFDQFSARRMMEQYVKELYA